MKNAPVVFILSRFVGVTRIDVFLSHITLNDSGYAELEPGVANPTHDAAQEDIGDDGSNPDVIEQRKAQTDEDAGAKCNVRSRYRHSMKKERSHDARRQESAKIIWQHDDTQKQAVRGIRFDKRIVHDDGSADAKHEKKMSRSSLKLDKFLRWRWRWWEPSVLHLVWHVRQAPVAGQTQVVAASRGHPDLGGVLPM